MWADLCSLCSLCMTKYWMRDEIRLGFTLLTSAHTNQDALSMLVSYCSTVCQCVEREDISSVTWALTSKEWNLIGPLTSFPCVLIASDGTTSYVERIAGVDGHFILYNEVLEKNEVFREYPDDATRNISAGEIGCAMSHIKLWRQRWKPRDWKNHVDSGGRLHLCS
jgi:hypothetical protein